MILNKAFNNNLLKILPFILLAAFSGFRYDVGKDYPAYERIFYFVNNGIGNEESFLEIGYVVLIKLVNSIYGTQQLVFLIFAIATHLLIYKYIRNHSQSFLVSTLIYLTIGPFFLSSFNGVRQALAIGLFAFSLRYILERRIWKYLLIIVFSSLFHKSILLMIPLYWVLTKTINLKKMIVILFLVFAIMELGVFSYLVEQTYYNVHLVDYTSNDIDLSSLIFFIIAIFVVFLGRKFNFNEEENIFYNLNFLSLCTVFASLFSNELSTDMFLRVNNYFMIGYIILIPIMINKIKGKVILYYFVLIFCITYYFITVMTGSNMLPYNINFKLFS